MFILIYRIIPEEHEYPTARSCVCCLGTIPRCFDIADHAGAELTQGLSVELPSDGLRCAMLLKNGKLVAGVQT